MTTRACIHTALTALALIEEADKKVGLYDELTADLDRNMQELGFFLDDLLDLHAWFDKLDIPCTDPQTGLDLDIRDRCAYLLS